MFFGDFCAMHFLEVLIFALADSSGSSPKRVFIAVLLGRNSCHQVTAGLGEDGCVYSSSAELPWPSDKREHGGHGGWGPGHSAPLQLVGFLNDHRGMTGGTTISGHRSCFLHLFSLDHQFSFSGPPWLAHKALRIDVPNRWGLLELTFIDPRKAELLQDFSHLELKWLTRVNCDAKVGQGKLVKTTVGLPRIVMCLTVFKTMGVSEPACACDVFVCLEKGSVFFTDAKKVRRPFVQLLWHQAEAGAVANGKPCVPMRCSSNLCTVGGTPLTELTDLTRPVYLFHCGS